MSNKRKRQEDFQKVKLKVGKKKPRADNATEVNFRSKSVHLSEQLKGDTSLPTTKRKLNITDLLSQIHHYNTGVKHSALVGLQELLSAHPSVIDTHISSIIAEVAAVFTDKEPTVRIAAVSLLKCLAPMIPQEKVAPFFPLVSAHLSSAMTHIIVDIQEDSLKILDILLEQYPDLLIDRSSMLLNNFLELISHQNNSKEKGGEKPSAWTLSINPNRKITSQKWRLSVLNRLKKFLQALVRQAMEKFPDTENLENVFSSRKYLDVVWTEHTRSRQPIKLYESGEQQQSSFRLRTLIGITGNSDEGLSSATNLKVFIQAIVPLLIECWVEEFPEAEYGNPLNPVSHNLLQQVLSIVSLLWKLSEHQDESHKMDGWLRKSYLKDFKHHFMKYFPYSFSEAMKQKKKTKRGKDFSLTSNGLDSLLLNLTLCDIMVSLASPATLEEDSGWLATIRTFITDKLMHGYRLNAKQLKRLLDVTSRLLNIQRNRATEKLIYAVYMMYQQKDLLFSVRAMLLNFFSKLYLKEEEICLKLGRSRSKVLCRWLANLPLQLAQLGSRNAHLSSVMINTIYTAAARANKGILQSLQLTACQIYDPQDGAFVLLPVELQQILVQLLYFLPFVSSDLLVCLNRCCVTEKLPYNLSSMLIGILHARSPFAHWTQVTQESSMNDTDYFSFLFSTLIGFSGEKLAWIQNRKVCNRFSRTRVSRICLYLTDQSQFIHHWAVTKAICHSLASVRARRQCFDILQNAINKHLEGLVVIPDSTVGSILCAINTLHEQCCIPNENLNKFLASCCYSIFNFLLTKEKDAEHMQKRDALWGACITLLSMLPNVLKLMLQSLQVSRACQEELPVIAQLLRLLLQNAQLRSYMMANAFLVQQTLQDVMNLKSCEIQEQWLTDLQYCFNVYLSKHPPESSAFGIAY